MAIIDRFVEKSEKFKEVSETLYAMINELAERIIILDLSDELGRELKSGFNTFDDTELYEEIRIEGCVFNLIQRNSSKYKAYVLHFERNFNTPNLGFLYKGEVVSPHMEGQVPDILKKYNNQEISEIQLEVEKRIDSINNDIDYLNSGIDLRRHKFCYRNYDGLFDGNERFSDLEEVFQNFKSLKL